MHRPPLQAVATALLALLPTDVFALPPHAAVGIHLRGPEELVAGTQAAYQIRLHWASSPEQSGPLAAAAVTLSLRCTRSPAVQLASGRTDVSGALELRLNAPSRALGECRLQAQARSRFGLATEEVKVRLIPGGRLLLTTDKPLYRPGQTIHFRVLALRAVDGRPLGKRPVELWVEDPRGNRVYQTNRRTSAFGIAAADFELADEVSLGRYWIKARLSGDAEETRRRVAVERYDLPPFAAELSTERRAYRPGETIRVTVNARYHFGKAVAQAALKLSASTDLCSTLGDRWRCQHDEQELRAATDHRGQAALEIELPSCRGLAVCEEGRAVLRLVATDAAHRRVDALTQVPISHFRVRLGLWTPSNGLVVGVRNTLHVVASTAGGRPLRAATVEVRSGGSSQRVTTDGMGTAAVTIIPVRSSGCSSRRRQRAEVLIAAEDNMGNRREQRSCLELDDSGLLVEPTSSLIEPGQPLRVELRAAHHVSGETALLEVIKQGQHLRGLRQPLRDGVARFQIWPDAQMTGLLWLRGSLARDEKNLKEENRKERLRAVYVEPTHRLQIVAELDRPEYRPGEPARLSLQVRRSDNGRGVPAALGLQVVDAALLALRPWRSADPTLPLTLEGYARQRRDADTVYPGNAGLSEWLSRTTTAGRSRAAHILLSSLSATGSPSEAETDPWTARRERWEAQSRRLIDAAKESMKVLLLGQRTAAGWRFHPELVSKLIAARRARASDLRDPWQRLIRPEHLEKLDTGLSFPNLAAEAAEEKLQDLYDVVRRSQRALGLMREPRADRIRDLWPVRIPSDLMIRLRTLHRVRGSALLDPWGQAFRVRRRRQYLVAYDDCYFQSRHEIFSVGPDGQPGTGDDVRPPGRWLEQPLNGCYFNSGRMAGHRALAPSVVLGAASASGRGGSPGHLVLDAIRERSLFPETLLWEPQLLTDRSGRASLTIPLADSITTWKVRAIASSLEGWHGQAQLDLRVFQPFFVDLDLPQSLTQGDKVSVAVTVHNYLSQPQQVELRFQAGSGLQSLGPAEHRLVVPASTTALHLFAVQAARIGTHQVRIEARARHQGAWVGDAVRRSLRIDPDGNEHRLVRGGEVSTAVQETVVIPQQSIPGSLGAKLTIEPGPLSQAVQGLEGLLQMPSGCFEQTSSTLYPNVLILQLLKVRRTAIRESVEETALRYIRAGYQRLLTFEVKGGGFSWFGDAPANQILTAYGLTEFVDIARVHFVDRELVKRTQRWLLSKQAADGSWTPDRGPSFDHVTGRLGERLRATAYIAYALHYSGYRGKELEQAVRYLESRQAEAQDAYTLALLASLLGRAGKPVVQSALLARLWELSARSKDGISFPPPNATLTFGAGLSAEVETAALALQALRAGRYKESELPSLVRWLLAHRDSAGSWHSTQATIQTLRGLLVEQSRDRRPRGFLDVSWDEKQVARIDLKSDRIQHVDLTRFAAAATSGPHRLLLQIRGQARLPYQLVTRYWVRSGVAAAGKKRELEIESRLERPKLLSGEQTHLVMRVRNRSRRTIAMPLVDVALPPAVEVDEAQLLAMGRRRPIEKVQRVDQRALLYLDELRPAQELHMRVRLRGKSPVEVMLRPSTIYEYYRPENRAESRPLRLQVVAAPMPTAAAVIR